MSTDMFPDSFIKYVLDQEVHMPDHGDNHKEYKGEGQRLGKQCGHHCGIITTGLANSHERHCPCPECHNQPLSALVASTTRSGDGMDPGTVT